MNEQYEEWLKKVISIANIQQQAILLSKVQEEAREVLLAENTSQEIEELSDLLNITAMALFKLTGQIDYEYMLKKIQERDEKYGT